MKRLASPLILLAALLTAYPVYGGGPYFNELHLRQSILDELCFMPWLFAILSATAIMALWARKRWSVRPAFAAGVVSGMVMCLAAALVGQFCLGRMVEWLFICTYGPGTDYSADLWGYPTAVVNLWNWERVLPMLVLSSFFATLPASVIACVYGRSGVILLVGLFAVGVALSLSLGISEGFAKSQFTYVSPSSWEASGIVEMVSVLAVTIWGLAGAVQLWLPRRRTGVKMKALQHLAT